MIIYSDPMYQREAHKALRKEGRIASNQLALNSLVGFMQNVRSSRERRDAEASQSEALAYYGRAMQNPESVPQLTQELVAKAQQFGGQGLGDEGIGSWLYGKFVGGNKGISGADSLGVLQGLRGIASEHAATKASTTAAFNKKELDDKELDVKRRNAATAEAGEARLGNADLFARNKYEDESGERRNKQFREGLEFWNKWTSDRQGSDIAAAEEARKVAEHDFNTQFKWPADVRLTEAKATGEATGDNSSGKTPEERAHALWSTSSADVSRKQGLANNITNDLVLISEWIADPNHKMPLEKLMILSDSTIRARLAGMGGREDPAVVKEALVGIRDQLTSQAKFVNGDLAKSRSMTEYYDKQVRSYHQGDGPPPLNPATGKPVVPPPAGLGYARAAPPRGKVGQAASPSRGSFLAAPGGKAPVKKTALQQFVGDPTPSRFADMFEAADPAVEKKLLELMQNAGVDMNTYLITPDQAARLARALGAKER